MKLTNSCALSDQFLKPEIYELSPVRKYPRLHTNTPLQGTYTNRKSIISVLEETIKDPTNTIAGQLVSTSVMSMTG
jgi:hypothetical protein